MSALAPSERKPLRGGTYSRHEALELINSHYLIGKSDQEVCIFRIRDDGLLAFTPLEQFRLDVANIFVRPSRGSAKPKPVEIWKENPRRHELKIVFKPGGATEPNEFNLWRGFGVEARKGWQKQRRLLRHILKIICRGDKAKFKYLIRWLAWAVQNPDKHPGVVIVLKSRKQGTGKSTLGVVMLIIFGQHGALIDDSDRLLGRFNDWVVPVSFILAEEILWAGDHKTADKLKSRVTADTFQIERKGGAVSQIPNAAGPAGAKSTAIVTGSSPVARVLAGLISSLFDGATSMNGGRSSAELPTWMRCWFAVSGPRQSLPEAISRQCGSRCTATAPIRRTAYAGSSKRPMIARARLSSPVSVASTKPGRKVSCTRSRDRNASISTSAGLARTTP